MSTNRYSNELSSIVDSIFFHLCSVFDYLGHLISYMFEQNKDKTLDWGSLAKKARAGYKDNLRSAQGIDEIDKIIRIKLEWHRSQLIHKKRDNRSVGITIDEKANRLVLTFAASPDTMKQFKNIVQGYNSELEYTLDCLPSAVFYQTLRSINYLLDFLKIDLLSQSTLNHTLKVQSVMIFNAYGIWSDYKNKLNQFYLTFGQA